MKKLISSLFAFSVILLGFTACNKLSKATYTPPVTENFVVKSNVLVVDSSKYTLISTEAQIKDGTYVYRFKPSITDIQHNGDFAPNTIIIGTTGQGYLRKVASISSTSETITLNTVLAKLEDVFQEAKISFKTGGADAGNPLNYTFDNVLLSQNTGTDVTLKTGRIALTQYWDYSMQIHNGVLTNFDKSCKEINYYNTMDLGIAGSKTAAIHRADTLKKMAVTNWIQAGSIPLAITTEVYLIANVDGTTNGVQNHTYTITNSALFGINTTYAGGNWTSSYTAAPGTTAVITGNRASSPATNITCNIVPVMNVKLYGQTISSSSCTLNNSILANQSATSADWDFAGRSMLQPRADEYTALLSYSASEFSKKWTADSAEFIVPYALIKVSGDNQTGVGGQYLPQPIVVRVADNFGNGIPGKTVYFRVTSGTGSLSYSSITSDANGLAQASWQFGYSAGTQTVEATAKNASGTNLVGSPLVFTAQ